MDPQEIKRELARRLEWFVLFHLGSDADWTLQERGSGFEIAVRHRRVEPFTCQISGEAAWELLSDPARLEQFMLEQLTRHRR